MKNSKEYSDKIKSLYKSLKKKYGKVEPVTHNTITEALVYGAIAEHLGDKAAQTTFANIVEYFSDLNELRVSRTEEILEIIDYENDALARKVAHSLIRVLASIFTSFHCINLEGLKKLGKRPARQALEKIESVTDFMIDYCMLTALDGHAIPLSATMKDYLDGEDLVYPDSDQKDIEGFLTRLISADQGYEFYSLLRQESDTYNPKKKKAVKKDEDSTAKKVTPKKATKAEADEKITKTKAVTKKASKKVVKKTKTKAVTKKATKVTAKKTAKKTVKKKTQKKTKK